MHLVVHLLEKSTWMINIWTRVRSVNVDCFPITILSQAESGLTSVFKDQIEQFKWCYKALWGCNCSLIVFYMFDILRDGAVPWACEIYGGFPLVLGTREVEPARVCTKEMRGPVAWALLWRDKTSLVNEWENDYITVYLTGLCLLEF